MQERNKLSSAPDSTLISLSVFWRLKKEHEQAATQNTYSSFPGH